MSKITTVMLQKATVAKLNKIKNHPRETMDDIINRLIGAYEE